MKIIKTTCPECHNRLEFPRDFDNVICPDCGTAFLVRHYKDTFSLAEINWKPGKTRAGETEEDDAGDLAVIDSRLAELDELIAEAGSETEELRSREQSGPLQRGCAFFGLFLLAITVIAAFMLLGRSLVGHWLFYLALAAIVFLGLARIRRKLMQSDQPDQLRAQRLRLEDGLKQLEAERERILKLRETIAPDEPNPRI